MDQKQQQSAPPEQASASAPASGLGLDMAMLWIETNRNKILAGIAMIGVAGLIFVIYTGSAQARQHEASAELFKLQGIEDGEPGAEDFRAVVAATKGTGIEQHARLREAAALFTEGKHADALTAYESFVRDFPASPLVAEAAYGVATCLESLGRNDEALAKYQELTTRYPQSALVNRARLSTARLQEKTGDKQQAFRTYQELASQMGSGQFGQRTGWQVDATIALRRMISEDPSLLQTNAPAAISSPTGSIPFTLPQTPASTDGQ
ncbi:MAG TPA: hypothetical protein DCY13_12745 [Verrucomicrobiales bacterium]|nr:hypothetical protein [Verrucomicrobiales bacterium]